MTEAQAELICSIPCNKVQEKYKWIKSILGLELVCKASNSGAIIKDGKLIGFLRYKK